MTYPTVKIPLVELKDEKLRRDMTPNDFDYAEFLRRTRREFALRKQARQSQKYARGLESKQEDLA